MRLCAFALGDVYAEGDDRGGAPAVVEERCHLQVERAHLPAGGQLYVPPHGFAVSSSFHRFAHEACTLWVVAAPENLPKRLAGHVLALQPGSVQRGAVHLQDTALSVEDADKGEDVIEDVPEPRFALDHGGLCPAPLARRVAGLVARCDQTPGNAGEEQADKG